MSLNYTIKFFGWCHEPPHHDKVWGWVEMEGKLYNFWGRRGAGKHLNFKLHETRWDLQELTRKKTERREERYVPITGAKINEVYPNFESDMKKKLFTARMLGKVRSEGHAGID
jgi:hypothetical protein